MDDAPFILPSQAYVRLRRKESWKKPIATTRRNQGKEYVSKSSGKLVPARKIGLPCKCTQKCYDRVGRENIESIFYDFWQSGDWNLQTAFIQNHVTLKEIKGKQTCDPNKQRTCSRIYFITVLLEPIVVCKQAFVNILGISKTRVNTALCKMTGMGMPAFA